MRELAQLLRQSEPWLLERVQSYARERGYARHTTALRMAWELSITRLSSALRQAIPGGLSAVEMGPDDAFVATQLEAFAVDEARLHRARGVPLGMFLGLLSYYRQGYLDLVEESPLEADQKAEALRFVARFFDRLSTGVAVEWNKGGEAAAVDEMRAASLRAQTQRHHFSAVFQALPSAVLLADPQNRVIDLNQSACRWLGQNMAEQLGIEGGACPHRDSFLGVDVATLLPWIGPALERMRHGLSDEQAELGSVPAGEKLTFLDTRLYPLFGVSGTFEGVVVVIQDVTALRDANETQARIASELRGQLREASGLNRLAEVLSQGAESEEELLQKVAEVLPRCWDAPGSLSARIDFDEQTYLSADGVEEFCPQRMEEALNVFGKERGYVRLCGGEGVHAFQGADAATLKAMARQLEHVLETRISLSLLSKSERQFRGFFNSAADAIFIHDGTGRILDANTNAGLWLNLSAESLFGTCLLESVAEAERETVAARFQNALRGTPELFQATLKRRDGFSIPVELLCQAQEFQGQPALFTSGRNITGRLRAQAEIERRLETEALVSAISGRLINTGDGDMTRAIEDCLADLCRFIDMPRGAVFLFDPRKKALTLTYQQRASNETALPESLRRIGPGKAPWFTERILAGERVAIRDAEHMPPAGRKEKALLTQAGIASLVAVPMTVEDRLLGVLALASGTPWDTARLIGSRVIDQATLLLANAIERQRTGAALRQSESLARAILDALPANLCVLDRRGVLTMVNKAWAATGPESTPLGGEGQRLALGGNYLEACRADTDNPHAAGALEGILAVLARRVPSFRLEYPSRVAGEPRWFVMQATPFAKGMAGAVVSHRDITERMRAITEMRESEERFRIIVETAQEAVVKIDANNAITYSNPRASTLFGYAAEEMRALTLFDIMDPADRPVLLQKLKRRRQGHSDQYELRFRHKHGHRIWTMVNASPLRTPDGGFAGSIGMITDITDRVRAEARLRRNEARYRSLVESMHEGLVMARRGGVITYANDRFCAMLGRKKPELIGRPLAEFAEAGSQPRLVLMLSASHADGQAGGPEEILWEHTGGQHIYSLVSPSVYADEEGKAVGFFAVVTDTTDRKGLESQLLHSQKLEAIGQLAAGIAHEINTPAQYVGNNTQFIKGAFDDLLAVIQATQELVAGAKNACPGPAEIEKLEKLMEDRDVSYLAAEVPGAINQTLEGVERISTIVRSVKQFAHPGAAVMAPADLNESMKSTATVSRNEWKYVAELDLDLDPALPLVVCMIGELNQVVLNLIINAAHAIADAKKLDPEREGRITLATRFTPPWAEIRVSDTGTGIPPAAQAKIFDPFFTTKEVGRGTGQGLTISRSIVVEKHKGQLFFETKQGAGTTFVVRLPLEQAE
ncbi:MAG TPA: PAS domain S-box protein [Humidesulfovibrio sp.]|uniref:PAS domain S-box protein n=1 Tax=Humidesulfovibrio sp. TaxID=2910988 RepID=UPI002D108C86|nr:PAS domain S-box protein [Humidesulfovibrio sp.]HWR03772.1 PAS domain S-box protein [Humidesulfovibrio sp.]